MTKKLSEPSSLEICILGPFRVAVDGVPVPEDRWTRRKAKILVQLLALEPHHQLHREQIVELFWPEYEPEAAANNLYKIVYMARRALESRLSARAKSNFIIATGNRVVLRAPQRLWIDVDEFEGRALEAISQVDSDACEAVLELYRGELLVDEPYEDWAMARRDRLRILHRKLVVKLAQLYEEQKQYRRSIERLRALIDSDPTDEHVHRQLMRLYALTGSKFQAFEQYKQCCAALRREVDAEPEPATVELSQQILQGLVKPVPLSKFQTLSPTFRQMTFHRGTIRQARVTGDGKAIVYAAAWEAHPFELYATNCDGGETQQLGFTGAGILSISSANELALSLRRSFLREYVTVGALACARLDGGEIREILEGVQWADWSPDNQTIVIVRDVGGSNRLEFPIGTLLYETRGWLSHPRFSPRGNLIAFLDHPSYADDGGSVMIVDLNGKTRTLSCGWLNAQGLAWSATGEEIWFTATKVGNARALHSVTLAGDTRLINRVAGCLTIQDILRDGRVLMTRDNMRVEIQGLAPGERIERNLSWFDSSVASDLSEAGRMLLFTEAGEGAGSHSGVYIRSTDGSPAAHLGNGSALALSPDGKWALALERTPESRLILLPIAAGKKPKPITCREVKCQPWACWLPNGKQILFVGNENGRRSRLYVQGIESSRPRPISSEEVRIFSSRSISPDGKLIAGINAEQEVRLYDLEGNKPQPISGLMPGEVPIRWASDGRSLYVFRPGTLPAKIHQVHLARGKRCFRKELRPLDPTGVHEILRVLLTPDLTSYAFTYTRDFSELYLVQGLS
jgi:DNA-binding SARP family transcriptional activator/Tol biopolymer transport system component